MQHYCKKLMKLAHKELGISPKDFWEMTFLELIALLAQENQENFTREDLNDLLTQFKYIDRE